MELKHYVAQDDDGNVLPGALCYVYERGTENKAADLRKPNGVPLSNPFNASNEGSIEFAAPNGLYDLRVVLGKRDSRIPIQLNDLGEQLNAANDAAIRAETARDVAMLEAELYATVEEGLSKTVTGQLFQAVSPESSEYLLIYLNQGGVAQLQRRYPTATAVESIQALVQATTSTGTESQFLEVMDGEEAQVALLTEKRFETLGFSLISEDGTTQIGDSEGGSVLYADDERVIVGGLEMQPTSQAGMFVVDEEGQVIRDLAAIEQVVLEEPAVSPFEGGLLFAPVIATAENQDTIIYPQNLLTRREQESEVVATITSSSTAAAVSGRALPISASRFGPQAVLSLRRIDNVSDRRFMPLTLKNVPIQTQLVPVKVLFIGDSIGNRQGGYLLKQYLLALGIDATFIGTARGSADANSAGATTGELGECREGWETGDYTNAITDRALILPPGEEQAYMSMSKLNQRDRNPFARAATAQDDASIVRNGYVFDCAFYQSRFNLQTPDIVLQALGTNNVRDRSAAEIYGITLSDDIIINNQIRKAWPAAKLIRFVPGTAINAQRNQLWTSHYTPLIRAIQQSALERADSKTIIAPLWAMANPEGAYALPTGTQAADGFLAGDWSDPIHPIGAARHALYQALAPFVAAAALNLI